MFTTGNTAAVLGMLALAILFLIIGVVLHTSFATKAAVCNSTLGLIGQEVDGASAQVACAGWTFGDTMGTVLMWLGSLGVVGTVLIAVLFAANAGKGTTSS